MNDAFRSAVFVGVAAVSLIVAWFTSAPAARTPTSDLGETGKIFYPDFKDPTVPDDIKVTMVDEEKAEQKQFEVRVKDGQWSIPSHNGYPADGKDRLAKTAASVINLKREELRSRATADHEKLGVLDPANPDKKALKGYGRRITLSEKGTPVMDLIIGREIERRPGYYFVRKPDEAATYVAKVSVDLSTKFGDWIEPDLLKIDRDDLTAVTLDNYAIDEVRGARIPGDVNDLTRLKSSDPWKLKGLDEAKEELEASRVAGIINTLDDLKLIGVRPKPAALRDALQGKKARLGPEEALSLQSKGFFLTEKGLLANEGEMVVTTNKGIVYVLQFGEIFTGDDFELETGLPSPGKKPEEKPAEKGAAAKPGAPATPAGRSGRYLFVRAVFDESDLPGKPVKPVKAKPAAAEPAAETPPKPEAAKPEAAKTEEPKPEEPKKEEGKPEEPKPEAKPEAKPEEPKPEAKPEAECDDPKPEEAPKAAEEGPKAAETPKAEPAAEAKPAEKPEAPKVEAPAEKPATDKSAEKPPAAPAAEAPKAATAPAKPAAPVVPVKTAEELEKEYQSALKQYETDLAAWKTKVTAGKKEAETLNDRFSEWYYLISAEDFDKLHVARKDLVKAKAPAAGAPGAPGTPPGLPIPGAPATPEPKTETPAKPEAEKPEAPKAEAATPEPAKEETPAEPAKPKAEPAKPEAPKVEAPKADEKPELAKPAEPPKEVTPKPE